MNGKYDKQQSLLLPLGHIPNSVREGEGPPPPAPHGLCPAAPTDGGGGVGERVVGDGGDGRGASVARGERRETLRGRSLCLFYGSRGDHRCAGERRVASSSPLVAGRRSNWDGKGDGRGGMRLVHLNHRRFLSSARSDGARRVLEITRTTDRSKDRNPLFHFARCCVNRERNVLLPLGGGTVGLVPLHIHSWHPAREPLCTA